MWSWSKSIAYCLNGSPESLPQGCRLIYTTQQLLAIPQAKQLADALGICFRYGFIFVKRTANAL